MNATYKVSKRLREIYHSLFLDRDFLNELRHKLRILVVETTNVCNADCVFCGYRYQSRPRQVINGELFRRTVDEFARLGGREICLSGVVGDPLTDPGIVEKARYCAGRETFRRIGMFTNCLNLHQIGAEGLLTSGLTEITVSTTGFDEEMYRRLFRNPGFASMRSNLVALVRLNEALGRPVKIRIALRIDRPPGEVLADSGFAEVAGLADVVGANHYYDSWSGRIRGEELPGNMRLRPGWLSPFRGRRPCAELYGGISVLSNGTITACGCRDLDGDSRLALGNMEDSSLEEAYFSQRLDTIRDNWLRKGEVPEICRDCGQYHSAGYLKLREVARRFLP